jgi:hypothetical protein
MLAAIAAGTPMAATARSNIARVRRQSGSAVRVAGSVMAFMGAIIGPFQLGSD